MQQVTADPLNEMRKNGKKLLKHFYIPLCVTCGMLDSLFESLQMDWPNIKFANNTNLKFAKPTLVGIIGALVVCQ